MPFLTLNELLLKPFEEAPLANEHLRRTVDDSHGERRVFLFYRVKDKDRVSSVVNIIKSLRLNVYVDYIEAPVLENAEPGALQVIRHRLYQADKAILLATPQLMPLHGFPLDFGLNGKFQYTRKVAVFPVTEHPQRWEDKDKYRIYGYIQKKYSLFNFPDDWQVVYPEGDRILVKDWLMK